VATLLAAILGAVARRGRARLTWAGFALFGWFYFGTTFGPWAYGNGVTPPPPYMTKWLFDYGVARLSSISWMDTGPPGELLIDPLAVRGGGSGYVSSVPTPPMASVWFRDAFQLRRIGNCLAAIVFGLVGSALGYFLAPRDDRIDGGGTGE
jgi:hypothetical protein